jgi:hypothetical protein
MYSCAKRIALIIAACGVPATLQAQFDFNLDGHQVQFHSFGSQGFAYSNQNNYLTMKTSDGSFAMTDGGVNVSIQLTDHFRIGAQGYTENVGQLYKWHPQLDWALADYKFKDWFGVRGGKVKTALGLYNDTQDMEFLHTWALLPQSLYPVDLRDNFISHLGGDVYGNVGLRRAGSLAYTGYAGLGGNNTRGGYYYSTAAAGITINDLPSWVAGLDLRWNTPVSGLQVGLSWMNRHLELNGSLPLYGMILPLYAEVPAEHLTSVYADYTRGRLHLASEYRRNVEPLSSVVAGNKSPSDQGDKAFFVSAAFRVAKRLELGAYNSRFYVDAPSVPGSAANHIFDQAVAARFDITHFWHLKLEGHFMDGYGDPYSSRGFYLRSNPTGTKPTMNMLVLRTGFNL